VSVAAYQGADPSQPGQSKQVDMNATPLLQFSGNEVYGATAKGVTVWWLGTIFETPDGTAGAGTIANTVVWHQNDAAYFAYETNNLTISNFVVRGDQGEELNDPYAHDAGIYLGDYMTRGMVVTNVDVQNEETGLYVPTHVGRNMSAGVFTVQNSYFDNIDNIDVPFLFSTNGAQGLSARDVVIQNVRFAHPAGVSGGVTPVDSVVMDTSEPWGPTGVNTTSPTSVQVTAFNGVSGDNFQVYYDGKQPSGATKRSDVLGWVLAD